MCLKINRGCRRSSVRAFFTIASRLGDGAVWYALMAVIAVVDPPSGWRVSLTMAIAGSAGVMLYRHLKTRLVRERPFVSHAGILCGATPLDRYSFPSGHTLHAVNFTILAATQYPLLLPILTPLALAIAASRVVLGLHYPSDVAAGAVIGAVLAITTLAIAPI